MALALEQAHTAVTAGEVPIGAVVVKDGVVIAAAHNAPIGLCDPTAHAEVLALRRAAQALGNYRLDGCAIYVTAEPCAMCAGAILNARLDRVVYATPEPKTGAAGSQLNLFALPALNAHTRVQAGVAAPQAQQLLRDFFAQQRLRQQQTRPPRLRDDAVRAPATAFEPAFSARDWPQAAGLQAHWHAFAPPCHNEPQSPPGAQPVPWRMHCAGNEAPANAPTALLVHGWADHGWVWHHWAKALSDMGWRVLVPDLLGHGQSDKPKRAAALGIAGIALGLDTLLHAHQWAQAPQRVLVLDASLAPLWPALALAPAPRHLLWVTRPPLACGHDSPALRRVCAPAFPGEPSQLRQLLDAQSPRHAPEHLKGYDSLPDQISAEMAPYPDKGHLSACQLWLSALRASNAGHANAAAADTKAMGLPNTHTLPAPTLASEPGTATLSPKVHRWHEAAPHLAPHPLEPREAVAPHIHLLGDLPSFGHPVPMPEGVLAWFTGRFGE